MSFLNIICEDCKKIFTISNDTYKKTNLNVCKQCKIKRTCIEKYGIESFSLTKEFKERYEKTCLEKYGVRHNFMSKENKEKTKSTFLEKYGVDHNFKSEAQREKIKKTNLEKYGSENVFGSKEIIERSKKTRLEKYGSECYRDKEKTIRTNLERYGVKNTFQLAKSKETLMKNFGVNHPSHNKEILEKSKSTNLEKYGETSFLKNKENRENLSKFKINKFYSMLNLRLKNVVEPMFSREEYSGVDKRYLWKCKTCSEVFMSDIDDGKIPRCPTCFPKEYGSSIPEKEVIEYVKSLDLDILTNDRKAIYPLELDIYCKERNIAIEFNGTYWHSSEVKEKWYHQIKLELCRRKNIRLLHIYEWEWSNNKEECIININKLVEESLKTNVRKPVCRFIQDDIEKEYKVLNLEKKFLKVWD